MIKNLANNHTVNLEHNPVSLFTYGRNLKVGFVNLSTTDILGQIILCYGEISYASKMLSSSLYQTESSNHLLGPV